MADVACFMVESTETARAGLRVYAATVDGAPCPDRAYHNAIVWLDETIPDPIVSDGDGTHHRRSPRAVEYRDDPRWPTRCDACGLPMGSGPSDEWIEKAGRFDGVSDAHGLTWQVFTRPIWRRVDGGGDGTMADLGPGAMFWAFWATYWPGPDGRCLGVHLPPGRGEIDVWLVDGPAGRDGKAPGWTRTGDPPDVTARPSVLTSDYHGFLTDGHLVDC